jgi:hypothetical protein
MTCTPLTLPNGAKAIVCGPRSHQRCQCGNRATLLCDWKRPDKKSGTCDDGLCPNCTTKPAPDKDLCPKHALALDEWKARR